MKTSNGDDLRNLGEGWKAWRIVFEQNAVKAQKVSGDEKTARHRVLTWGPGYRQWPATKYQP